MIKMKSMLLLATIMASVSNAPSMSARVNYELEQLSTKPQMQEVENLDKAMTLIPNTMVLCQIGTGANRLGNNIFCTFFPFNPICIPRNI